MLKTVVLLHIFVETETLKIANLNEQRLFDSLFVTRQKSLLKVMFSPFNACLLNTN